MAVSVSTLLLQHRYHGNGPAGLAQPHLDQATPEHVSASARLSAAVLVGAPPLPSTPDWLVFSIKMAVFVLLSSSIPESPRWLLLKKRLDVLERYRSNSPKDKRFLDLVTQKTHFDSNVFTDSSPGRKKRI